MRGAARVGGRAFKIPPSKDAPQNFNPLEALDLVGDLPVAPTLEPINDNWSWSLGAEPADPRDCARYPSSPYCGEIPASTIPFGYEPEIKTNGCETCLYIYPIILFLKATPQVICHRDPNCEKKAPPRNVSNKPEPYDENTKPNKWQSPECAARINRIHQRVNQENASLSAYEASYNYTIERSDPKNLTSPETFSVGWYFNDLQGVLVEGDTFTAKGIQRLTYEGVLYGPGRNTSIGIPADLSYFYINFTAGQCPNMPRPPKVTPPPPEPPFNDRKPQNRKKGKGKDMCCNDCADSKDNTEKLLREIQVIKKALGTGKLEKALDAAVGIGDSSVTTIVNLIAKRLGTSAYPMEVPESLLQGVGDGIKKIDSNAEFLHWLTYQFDSLVGQFPVDVDVVDIDPLKEGDQKKKIQLPNLAEAIAEIYGLTIKSSVNQEVELNMLLRLAAEIVATKNASVVTQDYARANAQFLGYKANFKPRELQYNFDFANASLDPRSKEPIVLEKLLKTVTGYVQGWQMEDKETVVGFLQKLMFSAGIVKAVFFRGKKQQKELQREMTSMAVDEKAQEAKFEAFIREINDPESRFNKDSQDKPIIKDVTPPDSKGAK
jgi:hypothetical protein